MPPVLLVLALSAVCPAAMPTPDGAAAVAACNQFALDLYGQLGTGPGNLFFSPYCISKTLAMVYAGARGETAAEFAAVLHFTGDALQPHRGFLEMRQQLNRRLAPTGGVGKLPFSKRGSVQISQGAALWGQRGYGFRQSFLDQLREFYGAGLAEVDFAVRDQACKIINIWVERQTAGKIPTLFEPNSLGPNMRLVLASAIYFKGDWANQFKKGSTNPEPFHVNRQDIVPVPMMNQTATFGYAEADAVQVLQMPYAGKSLAMLVLLPRDVDGLPALEKTLSAEKLAGWSKELSEQKVRVTFPRFKMEREINLPAALKDLGLKKAFTPGEADLGGMTSRESLWVDAVVHKAVVDVTEEGTEAAAATGAVMRALGMAPAEPQVPVFRADHPFLFAIQDLQTGVILFLGRFAQP